MLIRATPLTSDAFKSYGDVIAADMRAKPVSANMGTARRYNHLAALANLRDGTAKANLCLYRCAPATKFPFTATLLERHAHSSQAFIPMGDVKRYLVIVATGGNTPDLKTVKAFVASGLQGINYKPGTWHHPLVALDGGGDFSCLVFEDGTAGDCEEHPLEKEIQVELP